MKTTTCGRCEQSYEAEIMEEPCPHCGAGFQTQIFTGDDYPLFTGLDCDVCLNSGLTRDRLKGEILYCPGGCFPPNKDTMLRLAKVAFAKQSAGAEIDYQAFDVARILTRFTSCSPCSRRLLERYFFEVHPNERQGDTERKIKKLIETLRQDWLLPIGSRKSDPVGYWIITDLEDFKAWVHAAKSAPITQLSTIHKVARHNFPVFAEQMELEFWADLKGEDNAV